MSRGLIGSNSTGRGWWQNLRVLFPQFGRAAELLKPRRSSYGLNKVITSFLAREGVDLFSGSYKETIIAVL